jgi:glycosyltransferase involved in cell wall biosynthesis
MRGVPNAGERSPEAVGGRRLRCDLGPVTTVVIAAHDEAAVIGRCLDAILADARPGEVEIVVAANGCTDDTAAVARSRPGVRVVEIERPSKIAALNAAEAGIDGDGGFPRIYLDADIVATTDTIRALVAALEGPEGPLVASPERHLEVGGRPLPVRAYYAVQRRLPAFAEGLFGRGMIAVSREGRSRFEVFPDVIADDLFLDSLFGPDERVRVPGVTTTVETPRRTRDLVRRLVRVRRGNAALRAGAADVPVRGADRLSWLRDVVVPRPWLAPAAALYVGLTAWAAIIARRAPDQRTWGRDESSRLVTTD